MICPICITKNNYYSKSCKKCGCTLDTKQIDKEVEETLIDNKPVFLYQTKEEKQRKTKTNKKSIIFLSVVILLFISIFVIGGTQKSDKSKQVKSNQLTQNTEMNSQQAVLTQDKKKLN